MQVRLESTDTKTDLQHVKDTFSTSSWKDVVKVQEKHQTAGAHMRTMMVDGEKLKSKLAYFREGLLLLYHQIPDELLNLEEDQLVQAVGRADWSSEETLQLFNIVNGRLLQLQDSVKELEEQHKREAGLRQAMLKEQQATELKAKAIFQMAMRPKFTA
jgi:hypothetical protein